MFITDAKIKYEETDTKVKYQIFGTKHQLQISSKEWQAPDHHNLIVLLCVLIDTLVLDIHLIF